MEKPGPAEVTQPNDIVEAGSSKLVCLECELSMRERNVNIQSELKNDFSPKRKQQLSTEEQQAIRHRVEQLR